MPKLDFGGSDWQPKSSKPDFGQQPERPKPVPVGNQNCQNQVSAAPVSNRNGQNSILVVGGSDRYPKSPRNPVSAVWLATEIAETISIDNQNDRNSVSTVSVVDGIYITL
ncbi:hypothetical protein QYF36_016495 [Acer negundo]|nr:hypothetical protein QYF36_016495 [Acer negundo]